MAQQPQWAKAFSLLRIHEHTQSDTPHSVVFLWTRDRLVAEILT